jgi:hypothetical protein
MSETKKENLKINNLSPNWGIMLTMQENLNMRIGVHRRKKSISAAFWNYISTPINFVITLFTALSASQTGNSNTSNSFLSSNQVFYVLLSTFILSIINTFFKLKEKAQLNYDAAKVYEAFGSEFEDIYFTPILKEEDLTTKLKKYNELHKKIMTYSNNENIDGVNYITEFIFYLWNRRFSGRLRQIEQNERFWVLDGKPNVDYRNDYRVKMEEFFMDNFNEEYEYHDDTRIEMDHHNEEKTWYNIFTSKTPQRSTRRSSSSSSTSSKKHESLENVHVGFEDESKMIEVISIASTDDSKSVDDVRLPQV